MTQELRKIETNYEEMTIMILRANNIREGHWIPQFNFHPSVLPIAADIDGNGLRFSGLLTIASCGALEVPGPQPLSVDATTIW